MNDRFDHFFEFGDFRLDPVKLRLLRNDEIVPLTPKSLEVLILLVENRGRTVSRETILETIWKDTFIEEGNINFNVSVLRKSLGQKIGGVQYIKTVPKAGYRFVADVREVDGDQAVSPSDSHKLSRAGGDRRFFSAVIVGLAVITLATFGGWLWLSMTPAATPKGKITSVAVLPFIGLEESERDRFLRLALTDSLINRLGRLNRFAVRPLTAVIGFESSGQDSIEFARQMRVDAVLEGSVQQIDGRLRVSVRLLSIDNGSQIWSEIFDESEQDLFRLQDVICDRVARSLVSNLSAADQRALMNRSTEKERAYDYYLKGRELWSKRGKNLGASVYYFEKAIELDDKFALAYVGLADAQAMESDPLTAENTVRKAIALDENLPEVHATLGFIRTFHYFDWEMAEHELKRAIELNSNYPTAHHWLGVYYMIRGRFEDARIEMMRAHDLDPTSPVILRDIAQLQYFSGNYAEALQYCNKSIEMDPESSWSYGLLADVNLSLGREAEAFNALKEWYRRLRDDPPAPDLERDFPGVTSARAFWRAVILNSRKTIDRNPAQYSVCEPLVRYNLLLGNNKEAANYLDCLAEKGNRFTIAFLSVDPIYSGIRNEPRFQAALKKLNLP